MGDPAVAMSLPETSARQYFLRGLAQPVGGLRNLGGGEPGPRTDGIIQSNPFFRPSVDGILPPEYQYLRDLGAGRFEERSGVGPIEVDGERMMQLRAMRDVYGRVLGELLRPRSFWDRAFGPFRRPLPEVIRDLEGQSGAKLPEA